MVVGTGIDIIEVERIRRAAAQQTFLERIFTENERAYYEQHGSDAQTLAGTFAAKEATAKALAAGFNGISWRDIEILHDESGKPYVKLWNAKTKSSANILARTFLDKPSGKFSLITSSRSAILMVEPVRVMAFAPKSLALRAAGSFIVFADFMYSFTTSG